MKKKDIRTGRDYHRVRTVADREENENCKESEERKKV